MPEECYGTPYGVWRGPQNFRRGEFFRSALSSSSKPILRKRALPCTALCSSEKGSSSCALPYFYSSQARSNHVPYPCSQCRDGINAMRHSCLIMSPPLRDSRVLSDCVYPGTEIAIRMANSKVNESVRFFLLFVCMHKTLLSFCLDSVYGNCRHGDKYPCGMGFFPFCHACTPYTEIADESANSKVARQCHTKERSR